MLVIIPLFTRLISDMNWKLVNDFVDAIKHVNSIVCQSSSLQLLLWVENELSSVQDKTTMTFYRLVLRQHLIKTCLKHHNKLISS